MSDTLVYEQTYDDGYELGDYGRHDGWIAAFMIASIIFGPRTSPGANFPPVSFDDFVIILLGFSRFLKTSKLYGGFLFSPRIKTFSYCMFTLAFLLLFSTFLSVAAGRYNFFIKDLYMPVVFIRATILAAILASLSFGPKQVKQFIIGLILASLAAGLLAFVQKYRAYLLSGFIERLYAVDIERLDIKSSGTHSRVVGTFANANKFAECLVIFAAVPLMAGIYLKGMIKIVSLGTFAFLSLSIILTTASRTAFFSLLAVIGLSLLLSFRLKMLFSTGLILIIVFFGFKFLESHAENLQLNERMTGVISGTQGAVEEGLYTRYVLWVNGINDAMESPIFGIGARRQYTDSGYIIMLRNTGLLGFTVYMTMLTLLACKAVKAFIRETDFSRKAIILICMMILSVHLIFEVTADFFWAVQSLSLFAAFMGLLCGLAHDTKLMYESSYDQHQQEADTNYIS